jgi:hypothetical protein
MLPLSISQNPKSFNNRKRQILRLIAIGLISSIDVIRTSSMANTVKNFISFKQLQNWGRGTAQGGPIAAGGGPTVSLPVPVRRKGQPQVAFMVCRYSFSAKGAWMWPPYKIIWFDPVNGDYITEADVLPADFGQTDSVDKRMERDIALPSNMADRLDDLRERLFELYDILFEAWANKYSTTSHDKLQSAAREFLRIFDQISEKPLRPYYNALGRDWFEWLRELAR